ncbi:MAG: hypothetical protein J0I31_23420 [Rhizobiales bacterium]|nr:hypothetical protein [Hyphomicrobiales bacterium]
MIDMNEMNELLKGVRHVLLNVWDPIGIRDVPDAQDEYDDYLIPVLQALRNGAEVPELSALLIRIVEEQIGLSADAGQSRQAAEQLYALVRR